jgi:hypothetical protein
MNHPANSPDLAPSDYSHFDAMKENFFLERVLPAWTNSFKGLMAF